MRSFSRPATFRLDDVPEAGHGDVDGPDLDRAGVPRPGRSSPRGPHPPGECPVRRSSARMPTGLLKPPVGFAHRPLAPPGVRSAESSTTARCLELLGCVALFIFVADR